MVYESQIAFTLDTICPWTYLAKKRLDQALRQFGETNEAKSTNFTVKYFPYQLHPDAPQSGEDKHEWYKENKYGGSEERMKMYTTLMMATGLGSGIHFRFDGIIANTLPAHRLIQHFQQTRGPSTADRLINSLYAQYFEQAQHPSSSATLLRAAVEAGIPEAEARAFIEDDAGDLTEVRLLIREQASNGIDAVPYIVLEGRRRDFTLEGAREVDEYVKVMQQLARESS